MSANKDYISKMARKISVVFFSPHIMYNFQPVFSLKPRTVSYSYPPPPPPAREILPIPYFRCHFVMSTIPDHLYFPNN